MAKCCSDDDQHPFLQHHAVIFVSVSGYKMALLDYLSPQICIEFHHSVSLCLIFYTKAYLSLPYILHKGLLMLF